MPNQTSDIIIIGAGLTGLSLAYMLRDSGLSVIILEARSRIGGRIHTLYPEEQASQDMGATWLGTKHQHLTQLLQELEIGVFAQELGDKAIYEPMSINPPQLVVLPKNQDPSYRISGGSSALINRLKDELHAGQILTNQIVSSITQEANQINVKTENNLYTATTVISTLPPYLLTKTIEINPVLPEELTKIAATTHTWMGESIKISLAYESPFWKEENTSGTIFSNVGPIPEMYDHSDLANRKYALKGFLNGNYHSLTKDERLTMILKQLKKYYGDKASKPIAYHETVWRHESFTSVAYDQHILPHQNNGHPMFRGSYLDNRLYVAGAETAAHHSGYMDGAVGSAKHAYDQIMNEISRT